MGRYNYDDRLTQTIITSDLCVNIFWSDYATDTDKEDTIQLQSTDSIFDQIYNGETPIDIKLSGYSKGEQVLFAVRGQQSILYNNAQIYKPVYYYVGGGNLRPFKWAIFPEITYNKDLDKFALTFWANLTEFASQGGLVYLVSDSTLYKPSDAIEQTEKEKTKEENEKDSTEDDASTVKTYDIVDPRSNATEYESGSTNTLELREDTYKAILYSIGEYVSIFDQTTKRVYGFFAFSRPVIIKLFNDKYECVIDFHTGGGDGADCRIPYYVE